MRQPDRLSPCPPRPLRYGCRVSGPRRSLPRSLLAAAAVLATASCTHPQAAPTLNDGTIARQFDPYTGKATVAIEYLLQPLPAPQIDSRATDISNRFALAFVRDPSMGDVIVLRARHECWYNLDGKRAECLTAGCGARPQQVAAYGRLDGHPAQMPRFECKGWGRAAVEYSAAFTPSAMLAIASASEFWIRVPSGEIRITAAQLANLRGFLQEVQNLPAHLGPQSVDLRK